MTALSLPTGFQLLQYRGQTAVAGQRPLVWRLPGLSTMQPSRRVFTQDHVGRLLHHQVPRIALMLSQLRAEHRQKAGGRILQKLLGIAGDVSAVVYLAGQCIQKVGQRPVSARSHRGPDLLPLPMSRRPLGQNQILHVSALSQSTRLSLGAEPQLRMRRIRILTHAPQCMPAITHVSNGADT